MKPFLRPTSGPSDLQAFLAEPEKQWKTGFSAHALAHCWEAAGDLPLLADPTLDLARS